MIRSISGLASLMLSSDRAPPPSWASRGMWWRAPLSVLRRSDTVAVEADADGAMSMEVGTGRGGGGRGGHSLSLLPVRCSTSESCRCETSGAVSSAWTSLVKCASRRHEIQSMVLARDGTQRKGRRECGCGTRSGLHLRGGKRFHSMNLQGRFEALFQGEGVVSSSAVRATTPPTYL